MAEIRDLARSLDPELARLLGDEESVSAEKRWSGDARRGLELCHSMLRYARDEIAGSDVENERLDVAMAHVEDELARRAEDGPRRP